MFFYEHIENQFVLRTFTSIVKYSLSEEIYEIFTNSEGMSSGI